MLKNLFNKIFAKLQTFGCTKYFLVFNFLIFLVIFGASLKYHDKEGADMLLIFTLLSQTVVIHEIFFPDHFLIAAPLFILLFWAIFCDVSRHFYLKDPQNRYLQSFNLLLRASFLINFFYPLDFLLRMIAGIFIDMIPS